jgi:hypothetical protein
MSATARRTSLTPALIEAERVGHLRYFALITIEEARHVREAVARTRAGFLICARRSAIITRKIFRLARAYLRGNVHTSSAYGLWAFAFQ